MNKFRVIIILFLLALIFFNCDNKRNANNERTLSDSLKYKLSNVIRVSGNCDSTDTPCAEIKFEYPVLESEFGYLDTLNEYFFSLILNAGSEDANKNVDELCTNFFNDYENLLKEFPDHYFRQSLERVILPIYNRGRYFSISFHEFSFMGGAHPNYFTILYTFDLIGKKQLKLGEIFKTGFDEKLRKLGEDQFRMVRNLSPSDDLAEAGFWFDDNRFMLNDNFALTEKGIQYFFNSYEVGPYAIGTTEITIPYEEIQDLLLDEFQLLP